MNVSHSSLDAAIKRKWKLLPPSKMSPSGKNFNVERKMTWPLNDLYQHEIKISIIEYFFLDMFCYTFIHVGSKHYITTIHAGRMNNYPTIHAGNKLE